MIPHNEPQGNPEGTSVVQWHPAFDRVGIFPVEIDDHPLLTPHDVRVYLRIVRRAGKSGVAFESATKMAAACNMSRYQFNLSLKILEGLNMLQRHEVEGRRVRNITLMPPSMWIYGDEAATIIEQATAEFRGEKKGGSVATQPGGVGCHATDGRLPRNHGRINRRVKHSEGTNVPSDAPAKKKTSAEGEKKKAASPSAKKKTPPNPPRRPAPHAEFVGLAVDAWNEVLAPTWVRLEKPTGREAKYLVEFWKFFDKDTPRALEQFRAALQYLKTRETWWRERPRLTLAQAAANDKLLDYARSAAAAAPKRQAPGEALVGLKCRWGDVPVIVRQVVGDKVLCEPLEEGWVADDWDGLVWPHDLEVE